MEILGFIVEGWRGREKTQPESYRITGGHGFAPDPDTRICVGYGSAQTKYQITTLLEKVPDHDDHGDPNDRDREELSWANPYVPPGIHIRSGATRDVRFGPIADMRPFRQTQFATTGIQ